MAIVKLRNGSERDSIELSMDYLVLLELHRELPDTFHELVGHVKQGEPMSDASVRMLLEYEMIDRQGKLDHDIQNVVESMVSADKGKIDIVDPVSGQPALSLEFYKTQGFDFSFHETPEADARDHKSPAGPVPAMTPRRRLH